MNLISAQFILCMIITLITYYIVPKKGKNIVLLLISIIFYSIISLQGLVYIVVSTISAYFAAKHLKIRHKKLIFFGTVIFNIGLLVLFKSYIFLQGKDFSWLYSIVVPLGISYYTFQLVSYISDVYSGKIEHEKNFFKFVLYSMYFPYLCIGPINRYQSFKEEIEKDKKFNLEDLYYGFLRIMWGIFKKLIIANRIQILISTITQDTGSYAGAYAILAMILYGVQLYCDFSGGIDIVLGFSRTLQIKLIENFNLPYLADSIRDFWRRWHISLSSWFRDYVYIPLGGNKCGKLRNSLNILIVFTISGLWHGVNYILWGFLHGLFMIIEKYIRINNKIINTVGTFLVVSMLWSFYIWNDTILALKMIVSVFTGFNYKEMFSNFLDLGLNGANYIVLIIAIVALIIYEVKRDFWKQFLQNRGASFKLATVLSIFLIVLTFGIYGIGFNASEFIYNQF